MLWTDERVELLKKLLAEGYPHSYIAGEIGTTRNAVIGKAHRLGLVSAASPRQQRSLPSRARPDQRLRRIIARRAAGGATALAEAIDVPETSPSDAEIIPIDCRVTFLELDSRHCRWPIGEVGTTDFRFCGQRRLEGSSYCASHIRLGTQRR